ncbi:MAG: tetratricopeptide repeat protein, partial [Solirubrobacterales bacterium]
EQGLFRSVGVFVGGFGLDAAEFVWSKGISGEQSEGIAVLGPDVFDVLASLVDRSIVRQESQEGDPRFSMLETIRGFALEQLIESREEDRVRTAHAEWCLSLAEGIRQTTFLPVGQRGLRRLEIEHANVRAALDWLDRRGDRDRLLRLATALGRFWFLDGHYDEGRSWLERALTDYEGVDPLPSARAQFELGQLYYLLGERERGEALLEESIDVIRSHGDGLTFTDALVWKAWVATVRGDYDLAERLLEEVLGRAMNIPDPVAAAAATGKALAHLGVVAHERGDLEIARARHDQALHAHRELDDALGVIRSLRDLGDVARDQNDFAGALASYRESLKLLGKWGDPLVVVNALTGSALAAAAWGQPERAARLLGAAEAAREQFRIGVNLPADRAAHERGTALVRAALGESV